MVVGEAVTKWHAHERHRARALYLLQPPSTGPADALPPRLMADAEYVLITRRSGSTVLLSEHSKLGPEMAVRVLAIDRAQDHLSSLNRARTTPGASTDRCRSNPERVLELCKDEARGLGPQPVACHRRSAGTLRTC